MKKRRRGGGERIHEIDKKIKQKKQKNESEVNRIFEKGGER